MYRTLFILTLASLTMAQRPGPPPRMQIALLLDTSNSMDGLIHQAKTQLWTIVNELATAKRDGQIPQFEVGLYEYGNSGLSSQAGYVRQVLALTSDLDRVSEALFELTTHGGDEYCARVINQAVTSLAWSPAARDYKAVFIAGNEPFNQGPEDFRAACRVAIGHGIVVNTIHCGPDSEGINGFWKEAAELADGRYACINQDQAPVAVVSPFDDEILRLNRALNDTYMAYGQQGQEAKERQMAQDSNAEAAAPAAAVQRSVSKASAHYRNESWDLVDAIATGVVELDDLEEEQLPEPMRAMSPPERAASVRQAAQQRKSIQSELNQLHQKRQAYIAQQPEPKADASLKAELLQIVRDQLVAKSFDLN